MNKRHEIEPSLTSPGALTRCGVARAWVHNSPLAAIRQEFTLRRRLVSPGTDGQLLEDGHRLRHHRGDVAGVGRQDEGVVGPRQVLEGLDVLLGHRQVCCVLAVPLAQRLGHHLNRLSPGLAGGHHRLGGALRRIDQLLLLGL